MKKTLTVLFLLCLAVFQMQAKYVARPILESTTTEAALKDMLVMDQAWVPYPAYADRAGWESLLGKDRDAIIAQGEKYLDCDWIAVKAEYYLAYARNGNRTLMQNALGRNTTALSCLMMAELAEGKGRFMDDIVNGILYFCETTSWAISAHLSSFQKDHSPFPDWRDNILELTQGGISQMMCWIYYFFNKEFDKIYDGISPRLRYEIQRRELTPYLERTDFWWMGLSDGMARTLPAISQPDLARTILQAYHGSDYQPVMPTTDDFDIWYTVNYTGQWQELNLVSSTISLNDYKAVKVEFDEKPLSGYLSVKVYGANGKEQYVGVPQQLSYTVTFNRTTLGSSVQRVTLQYGKTGSYSIGVRRVCLIKSDGTEEDMAVSPFWGCTVESHATPKPAGLADVMTDRPASADAIYSLSGQRVLQPMRGIYIRNGRKYIK